MSEVFTEIVFVRHGETDGNCGALLQGRGNGHLSETGFMQAKAAALELADTPFTAACSSDLDRAVQTASIILEKHPGIELETTPELEEWNVGDYEGRNQLELLKECPEVMHRFRFETGDFDVPGGESKSEFQRRVSRFLDAFVSRHKGGCILLVSHGWTAGRLLAHMYGSPASGMRLPVPYNTGISRFRHFEDGSWQMLCWNSTGHLKGLSIRKNPVD